MPRSMPIIEARQRLTTLPEELAKEPDGGVLAVTRRGQPVLAILPWEVYEALTETLAILGDEAATDALRRAVREVGKGKAVEWEGERTRLGR